jgi:hypothetical protein
MSAKLKIEMSVYEMAAIIDMIDSMEAMIDGSGDDNENMEGSVSFDKETKRTIKIFDKMLKRNGYKR